MVEHSFQCEPNVTCSGETNDDNNDFLSERGDKEIEKSLIDCFLRQIFGVECYALVRQRQKRNFHHLRDSNSEGGETHVLSMHMP